MKDFILKQFGTYTQFGLGLIFLLFPLYLWRFSILGVPTTFLELLIYLVFSGFVLEKILFPGRFSISKSDQRARRKLFYPVLLIVLGSLIGVWRATDTTMALGILKGFVIDPLLVFYLLLKVGRGVRDVSFFLLSFTASALVLSYYGIVMGMFSYDARLLSVFDSANFLAMLIAPLLAYFLIRFFVLDWELSHYRKLSGYGVLILLLAYPLSLTQSYAAILGLVSGVSIVLLFLIRRSARKFGGILLFLFILFGVGIGTQLDSSKFQQLTDFQTRTSSSVRLEIWQIATGLALENPLLGIGLGQFQPEYAQSAYRLLGDRNPLEWSHPQPHNLFLAFWLNAGLLGLLGFLYLLWLLGLQIKKHQKNVYVYSALALMLTILIHGLFDTPFWKNDLALLFWLGVSAFSMTKDK